MMTINDKIRDKKLQYDINREIGKISALSSEKIDKYEYLSDEEILTPDQRRVIEQAKFAYSPLGKAFEKQTKTIEEQGKKQIKAIDDHGKKWLNLMNLLKKIIISIEIVYHLINKKIFNKFVEEKSYEFQNLKEKINHENLIYNYKTEGKSPKEFSDYQNLIDLFITLRNGNVNPREVLKNQNYFKSDLSEIKIGNKKVKIKRSNNCYTKCLKMFLI